VSPKGNFYLKLLFDTNHSLFIMNEWEMVETTLGVHIIEQYQRLTNEFQVQYGRTPEKLKRISITKSFLTDQFCVFLSQKLGYLSAVEHINLSGNNLITNLGKKWIYLVLISQSNRDVLNNLRSFKLYNSVESRSFSSRLT